MFPDKLGFQIPNLQHETFTLFITLQLHRKHLLLKPTLKNSAKIIVSKTDANKRGKTHAAHTCFLNSSVAEARPPRLLLLLLQLLIQQHHLRHTLLPRPLTLAASSLSLPSALSFSPRKVFKFFPNASGSLLIRLRSF